MLQIRKETKLRADLIRDPGEIDFYSDLLTRRHYLESSQCNRNTILHVVRRGGEDVAILTWEPKVRMWFALRDKLIGWTEEQKKERLKYCVENRRFLMLVKEKDAASQALALSLKRLCVDGQKIFGHEFLLAETFVDPSRGYEGTCYKAAGWTRVGLTRGGRGKQVRTPKLYFVKDLKKDALSKLKSPELTPSDTINPRQSVLFLERLNLASLRKKLDSVPDYRRIKGKNPLSSILALTIAAVLGGQTNSKGIYRWIASLSVETLRNIGCRRPITYTTLWRVITRVDHEKLSEELCSWLREHTNKIHVTDNIRIVSLDGKALRSASKGADAEIHVLSLIDTVAQVLISQRPVSKKKDHEIPVARLALEKEPLDATTVVTADALHTQRETANIIIKKNGHYVLAVKDNQPNLRKAIQKETPNEAWSVPYITTELGHGRIEKRTIRVAMLKPNELDFPGSHSIALITRSFTNKKTGKESSETTPYISSLLEPTPEIFLDIARQHWTIENRLHYKKDVTYQEDRQTMHTHNGPLNMSLLRSFAISCANLAGCTALPDAITQFHTRIHSVLKGLKCPVRLAEV